MAIFLAAIYTSDSVTAVGSAAPMSSVRPVSGRRSRCCGNKLYQGRLDKMEYLSPRVTVHFLAEVLSTLSFGCLDLKLLFLLFITSC